MHSFGRRSCTVLTQFVRTCSATISQPSHSRQPATNTKHADDIFLAVSGYSAWQKMFVLGETPQWRFWKFGSASCGTARILHSYRISCRLCTETCKFICLCSSKAFNPIHVPFRDGCHQPKLKSCGCGCAHSQPPLWSVTNVMGRSLGRNTARTAHAMPFPLDRPASESERKIKGGLRGCVSRSFSPLIFGSYDCICHLLACAAPRSRPPPPASGEGKGSKAVESGLCSNFAR